MTHELAGKTVRIVGGEFDGDQYRVEDWWTNVSRVSHWSDGAISGNPACLEYALRAAKDNLPLDHKVVYGKIGPFGKLMHVSQLGPEVIA